MDARIAPVEPVPADPELAAELARWMPPGAAAPPLLLFRSLARHPALMQAMRPLGAYILGRRFRLSLRLRELLILRVCARCACAYEWGVHAAAFGAAAGLDADVVAATVRGAADAPCFAPIEQALLAAVDELCAGPALSNATWEALGKHFDDAQRLEILVASGWYRLISTLCNGLALPDEAWAAPFPA